MQALWLEDQVLSFREGLTPPEPPPGEALIRVRLAGICATDLELLRGYYPFRGIPGHEFVGEVVEAASAPDWIGKRVVGEINAVCGECETCRAGYPTHCEQRTVLGIVNRNGAFAEFLTLPLENLHCVPASLPDEAAVFTEPLAAALEIQQQVQLRPTHRVIVIGAGRLGQLIARTLALTGCDLRVVARHAHQRQLLAERGIATIFEAEARKADMVVEASGTVEGFELARAAIKPRGVIVLKSTYRGKNQVNFSSLVVDEITLIGSRCGPFSPALRLLESREIDPLSLIEARYPLSEGLRAFEYAAQPGVLKVLLTT
jgi:threonine dehydrogenase-like Zn-dependent dehydrogenase